MLSFIRVFLFYETNKMLNVKYIYKNVEAYILFIDKIICGTNEIYVYKINITISLNKEIGIKLISFIIVLFRL